MTDTPTLQPVAEAPDLARNLDGSLVLLVNGVNSHVALGEIGAYVVDDGEAVVDGIVYMLEPIGVWEVAGVPGVSLPQPPRPAFTIVPIPKSGEGAVAITLSNAPGELEAAGDVVPPPAADEPPKIDRAFDALHGAGFGGGAPVILNAIAEAVPGIFE